LEGKKNLADRPSRRPSFEIGYEYSTAQLVATQATNVTVEPHDNILPAINAAQQTDSLAIGVKSKMN
jgi:hypothetical protein